jgi:hypothetical protein
MERAFGDVHEKCTRNHTRTPLPALRGDVEHPLQENGPWTYKLAPLYSEPDVTAAVENLAAEACLQVAACVYESRVV